MSGVRKGEPWGAPAGGPADLTVTGGDIALVAAVTEALGTSGTERPRLAWDATPDADFARALGNDSDRSGPSYDLPCDALTVEAHGRQGAVRELAVNMVVVGTAPDRLRWWDRAVDVRVTVDGRVVHDGTATGMVVANGEFLRGADVIPRGHPGDGRIEVQVYAVPPGERRALRIRLRTGTHVPHPGIVQASGRQIEAEVGRAWRLEVDGSRGPRCTAVTVSVLPQAFVLVT